MEKKFVAVIFLSALLLGCSNSTDEQAKSPSLLPVFEAPVTSNARAMIPDFSNPNKELDYFVPAITSFKQNTEGVSVNDTYSVTWGDVDLVFTISELNGVFTYVASKEADYVFELVFDETKNEFHYYHELNIDQSSTDPSQADIIVKTVIPDTVVGSDGEFKSRAILAGYALGGPESFADSPGMFLLYDEIEIYNGIIEAVQSSDLAIDTARQNGYGFAYYLTFTNVASEEYSMSLTNTSLFGQLDNMISDSETFKNYESTISMIQASIGVSLDDNTSFFETDAGWEDHEHHLWTTQCPGFSTFKTLIPWESELTGN